MLRLRRMAEARQVDGGRPDEEIGGGARPTIQ